MHLSPKDPYADLKGVAWLKAQTENEERNKTVCFGLTRSEQTNITRENAFPENTQVNPYEVELKQHHRPQYFSTGAFYFRLWFKIVCVLLRVYLMFYCIFQEDVKTVWRVMWWRTLLLDVELLVPEMILFTSCVWRISCFTEVVKFLNL